MTLENYSLLKKIKSKSESDTIIAGRELVKNINTGRIIGLEGDLGTGKTIFVRGLTEGIKYKDKTGISSPTFKLINTYEGRIQLYHIDLYRLKTVNDIIYTGIFDLLNEDNLIAIEWAEKLKPLIINFDYYIIFKYISEKERVINIYSSK